MRFIPAVLAVVVCVLALHAEPIDSLQKQLNTKEHELFSDSSFGFQMSQLEPEAVPGFLSYLLKTHLRDTMQVYHMAALVKEIAWIKRQQSQVMVKCHFVAMPMAQVLQKRCTQTVAMIDNWYEGQGSDEPTIAPESHKLHLDIIDHD